MQTVTKKDFTKLHKAGKLSIVAACSNTNKNQVEDRVLAFAGTLPIKPVSRVDVGNYGGGFIERNVASFEHLGKSYYVLETVTDNSKCNTCSMFDVQYDVILYVLN